MEIWKGKIVFNFRPSQNQSRIVMSKIVYNLNLIYLTILILYNEHKSNNNTIFDRTDYDIQRTQI